MKAKQINQAMPWVILGCMSISILAVTAMAGVREYRQYAALEACAKVNNVYECQWQAVPVGEPRVVVQQAEILPPPVEG